MCRTSVLTTSMSDGMNLSNFKISTKLKSLTLNYIQQQCLNKDIVHKRYSNYICFEIKRKKKRLKKNPKEPDYFAYSIWKKNECLKINDPSDTRSKTLQCNVTKIKKNEIEKCLRKLERLLRFPIEKTNYTVDNITATIYVGFKINLRKFEKQTSCTEDVRYNPERFPGLVIKKNKLTYVVFSSGAINIVGGKSKEQILKGLPWITSIVPQLEKKYE